MPDAAVDLQQLFCRLADGDRSAIQPAFVRLWPLLRGFAARALANDADAEDAAQRAIAKLFAQVADFDASRNGVAWALAVVSYECRTIRQTKRRRREEPLERGLAEIEAPDATPESQALRRDLDAAARAALAELRTADAHAILVALADERPTGAAFRKRLQRALGRLRMAWRAKHGTE
jgi:RNA polymerase sigma-70 factor (ECF subfamily)